MKQALQSRWQAFSPREQTGLQAAGFLLLAALVWTLWVQPAWWLWRQHDTQVAALAQQRQQMVMMQSQAQALQKRTPLSRDESFKTLQTLTRNALPTAQLSDQGDRVSIRFKAAPAAIMAAWLQDIRENAQVRVVDAQWQRSPQGSWDGTMVLQLPSRQGQP